MEGGRTLAISGFELSYKPSDDVSVRTTLEGVAPSVTQTTNKTIVRITEYDANGKPVTSSQVEKTALVINTGEVASTIASADAELQIYRTHIDEKAALGIDTAVAEEKYNVAQAKVDSARSRPSNEYADALRMKAASFDAHRIVVTRDYAPDLPRLNADRHKILQILINLLSNAQHALLETGQLDKRLLVAVRSAPEGFASIRVRDNGVGIPRENITRIFQHGFPTKKDGHGFGLHSGANAAREIGGRLIAHSDGRGQGAEFILELPLNCKETGIMP